MKSSLEPSLAKTAGAINGMSRFLSKREKNHKHHSLTSHDTKPSKASSTSSGDKQPEQWDKSSPTDFYGLFHDTSKAGKDEEAKIKTIKQKLLQTKGVLLKDGQILWALRSHACRGECDAAYHLLVALSDASEGILTPFDPSVRLRGAANREMVTCFLDSTLFSMFSRLDSFEAMLYNSFEDEAKERLAFLLRLWVNLLRSGQLISTDITREIQESLAQCGWEGARKIHQQDASEAFTFITEKLNLPLLTLKMDIYHTGKQDSDDHKFINERLLEVAIPTLENGEHPKDIKLEDCLEEYFNNRIEVKRFLERRNTQQSTKSSDKAVEAGMSVHVETVEIDPEASTPLTPISPAPSYMSERPINRHRAPSIIQERFIPGVGEKLSSSSLSNSRTPLERLRAGSVRKEVLMPAWQFFSLIPWYTDHAPSSDAQVAAHFSSKRPVLGLCLKRYSYTAQGRAIRLNTNIDIPIEIALPHFIQDDQMDESAPLYGNFKLSLQSVVCHRGNSVDSGHYISLVRTILPPKSSDQGEASYWLRFDDLAQPRVSLIDIHKALQEETPYLLFYQILPVDGDPGNVTSGEKPLPAYTAIDPSNTDALAKDDPLVAVSSAESPEPLSGRPSVEIASSADRRGRSLEDEQRRRSAILFNEQHPVGRKSLDAKRDETQTIQHQRSGSFNGGFTKTFSKLGGRSKKSSFEDMKAPSTSITIGNESGPQVHINEVPSNEDKDTQVSDGVRSKIDPGLQPYSPQPSSHASGGLGRSRSKREKSRSRLLKTGKGKSQEPDRECVVM